VELTAATIARATAGEVLTGRSDARASSFTIDSRLVRPAGCFFALEAARDGHAFVSDAFERGASIAVVRRRPDGLTGGRTLVQVADPLTAVATLGRVARRQLARATVVGVTGSAGKTATKDLIAAAVAPGRRVHASHASYNNETGLPLTLLDADESVEVVVAEMGARFAGNIAELAAIARPEVGVVTHVGMAHAELLAGRAGIARVKGELLEALPPEGLAVLNDGCDATPDLAARTRARVLRVGAASAADVRFGHVVLDEDLRPRFRLETPWGSATVRLTLRGEHQVENAAMGAAVALWLGVSLEQAVAGLGAARGAAWRMELSRTPDGIIVLNDAYNSSPTSVAAAVRALARLDCRGRRIAVLGEMLELGEYAEAEHVAAGALAGQVGVDLVVAVGPHAEQLATGARSAGVPVVVAPDAEAAVAVALDEARAGDAVLVKGSRAVGLEEVATALLSGAGS